MKGNYGRNRNYVRLICTSRWQHLRHRKMVESPLCEDCRAKGIYRSATEVHHVIPVTSIADPERQERLLMDYGNLASLCHECHLERHRQLGKQTVQATKDRHRDETAVFKRRFFGVKSGGGP